MAQLALRRVSDEQLLLTVASGAKDAIVAKTAAKMLTSQELLTALARSDAHPLARRAALNCAARRFTEGNDGNPSAAGSSLGVAARSAVRQIGGMNDNKEQDGLESDALDDDALDQAAGGTGQVAHELAHTVQQGSGVGANETITVGANRSVSVGTTQK